MRRTELVIPGLILAACLAIVGGYFLQHRTAPLHLTGEAMGMSYRITVARPAAGLTASGLAREIDALLTAIQRQISTFDPQSEISQFNASDSTDFFPVSAPVANLLHRALQISHATGGMFDPTIAPLVDLWGFGPVKQTNLPPDPTKIRAALDRVSYHHLEARTDPPAIRKHQPDARIDLSGVGEGFIAAQIARHLDHLGVTDYLIQFGSQVQARGLDPAGLAWRIGIEEPQPGARRILRTIPLSNLAMATSGSYRNHFTSDGHTYNHILSPHTGAPVEHNLVSVTVLSPDGVLADGMATAIMAMGPERGWEFAQQQRLTALLILKRPDGTFDERPTSDFNRQTGQLALP